MHITTIIQGIIRYVDRSILPSMNSLQEVGYLTLCELALQNPSVILDAISKNFIARTYLGADRDGNIDIDRLYSALEHVMQKKGAISFDIPLYGAFKLNADDLRALYNTIKE
jgi:hypothetical protein